MDKLLIELHNHRSAGLIKEQQEDNDTIVRRSLSEFGVMLDGIFTFGAGITAFLPMVRDLINNEMPHIDETTIPLLYIVAIWSITGRHLDLVRKLTSVLKERGLLETLSSVVRFLKSVEDVSLKVAREVGHAASDITDIGAFTFLMFPIMDGILYLINEGSITLGDPAGYLKSVLIGIGVIGIKNIFNSIISKIRFRLRNERIDESVLKTLDDSGVSSDVIKVIKSTMFTNNSSSWVLPECVGGDVYTIGDTDYTIHLTVSRDVSLRTKTHLIEVSSLDKTIMLDVTINPHKEHVVYRNIKNTIRECIWKFNTVTTGLLSESDTPNRIRNVYEDDQIKLVVPLDRDTFCKLAKDTLWCTGNEYGGGNPTKHVDIVRKGTPYIHINKKDGTKHLFHGRSRIPFYDLNSGESANLTVWDAQIKRETTRKFLSKNKGLYKLFNIEYDIKERLKYDIPLVESELNEYAKTNKFTEAINKIRLNYNEETEEELSEFSDDVNWVINYADNDGQYYNKRWMDSEKTYVDIKPFGLEMSVPTQIFITEYLGLSDDESWVFNEAYGGHSYNGYDEHVDSDELNYIDNYISTTAVDKLKELAKMFGDKKSNELFRDGDANGEDINDFLDTHYKKKWSDVGSDMLYTMSQGISEHKQKEIKEFFDDESVFEFVVGNDDVDFSISWDMLLYICHTYNIESFDDLSKHDINLVEGAYDTYSDAWGFSEEYREDIEKDFTNMIDELIENFTSEYKENIEHYQKLVKDLGFGEYHSGDALTMKKRDKHIFIDDFDPNTNMVKMRVTPIDVGWTSQAKYRHIVHVDDVVNYVQSDELDFEEDKGPDYDKGMAQDHLQNFNLSEQKENTLKDKMFSLVKDVGYSLVKYHPLSQLIKLVAGAKPTKARLIFPKKGWEEFAVKALEAMGLVTGTYKTLKEANEFFKQLKDNSIILEEVLIGSHGNAGTLLVTPSRTRKKGPDQEVPMMYRFNTGFLKGLKEVVNSSTKVYFTACKGADKLTMLKEASDYLGCECFACMGINYVSMSCEDSNWSCSPSNLPSFEFAHKQSKDERALFTGSENFSNSKEYTEKVNKYYEKQGVCQEQPNVPFNWVTLFG